MPTAFQESELIHNEQESLQQLPFPCSVHQIVVLESTEKNPTTEFNYTEEVRGRQIEKLEIRDWRLRH